MKKYKHLSKSEFSEIKQLISFIGGANRIARVAIFTGRSKQTIGLIDKSKNLEEYKQHLVKIYERKKQPNEETKEENKIKVTNHNENTVVPEWAKLLNNNIMQLDYDVKKLLEKMNQEKKTGWFTR